MHKNRLFLFLFALLAALSVQAQVGEPRHNWAVGVSGGMTMNRVLFRPTIRQTWLAAPTAGITVRYMSEKYFNLLCALQVELNYARLGWKEDIYSSTNTQLPDTYQRRIDYLQLPILTSLGLGNEKRGMKGFLLLGPQVAFALNDREERSSVWTTRTVDGIVVPDRANNVYAQYGKTLERRFEYGICAGLGMELTTPVGHFLLDARYYYGLSDMFGNSKRDPFSRSPHNTISAKISYLIDLTP